MPCRIARSLALTLALASAAVTRPGLSLAQPASAPPVEQPAQPAQPAAEPYIRILDDADTGKVRLELALRSFRRPADNGSGPVVTLASVIHIGDRAYYEQLQSWLDAQDVVLFEGVKPPGSKALPEDASDEKRAKVTLSRLKVLVQAIERYFDKHGVLPDSLDDLKAHDKRFASLVDAMSTDGWGRRMTYAVRDAAQAVFEVASLGADNAAGGEGPAADLSEKGKGVGGGADRKKGPGIQQQLADALGLEFQLSVIDSGKANWRSSDMAVDELQERIEAAGGDASALLNMLDGSSLMSRMMGAMLGFIRSNKAMSTTVKIMVVEMMGAADKLLEAGKGGAAAGPLGKLGPAMKVIVHDRNAIVIEDLKGILEKEPQVKSVAAFYGAGHMPDLEKQLVEDLGFKAEKTEWFRAIEVDPKDAGMSPAQVKGMRAMIKRQVAGTMKPHPK